MFEFQLEGEHLVALFFLGVSTSLVLYWYSIRNHDYWKKKRIPFIKPLPFFGTALDIWREPVYEVEIKRYSEFGPLYGYFEGNKPMLSVADPKLIKDILVKDFSYFTTRRSFDTGDDIQDKMLLSLRGEDWKRVRTIVTPTFTTGKIRKMLSIFKESTKTLVSNFRSSLEKAKHVDVKRLYGAFSMDVIASSAFSTKIDSHNNPDNMFVKTARETFTGKPGLKSLLMLFAPRLFRLLNFLQSKQSNGGMQFFKEVTLEIVKERRMTGQVRDDFLQLLMDTAKEVEEEEKSEKEDVASNYGENSAGPQLVKNLTSKNLSKDELVAQCVIFFLAGYETTASTLSFATYLLALNQDVQDKLREEILQVLKENNNELTYEAVQNMKYLDNVISETLRIFPPAIRFQRIADADYKLRDTGIVIPKGMTVSFPTIALHRDPKYFPDPDKFDPDRFTPEERAKRDPYTYLPFGTGPRNCVGMRFALIEIKASLAHIISSFNIKRSPHTKVPLKFRVSTNLILQPTDITVELEARKDAPLS